MTPQSPPIVPERGVPLTAETVVVPVELLSRALEELRMIRMKDCDAVYDTTLRVDHQLARQLAAPAREPEGGAVDARAVAAILNPALFSHDKVEAHRAASPMAVTVARSEAVEAVRRVLDAAAALTPKEAPASDEVSEALVEAYRYISQPQSMGQGQATYSTAEYNRLTAKIRTAIGWEGTK